MDGAGNDQGDVQMDIAGVVEDNALLIRNEELDQHSYFGPLTECRNESYLEAGSIIEIPMLVQEDLVPVPGEDLPLVVYDTPTVRMLLEVVEGGRIPFGVVTSLSNIGATADVYKFTDCLEEDGTLRIVARIRQRFKLTELNERHDGIFIGKACILPEVCLSEPLYHCRIQCLDRHRNSTAINPNPAMKKATLYRKQYNKGNFVWPSWVYKAHEAEMLYIRTREELDKSLLLSTKRSMSFPENPTDLSYWIIQNLSLETKHRLKLMNIDSVNQRLRAELSIMQQLNHQNELLCCCECDHAFASQRDVFAMSSKGLYAAYVNPFGRVHETLTISKANGLRTISEPSTDFTWFPGYAWSIAQCFYCHNHMGWLFTATEPQLEPQSFWGCCRSSMKHRQPSSTAAADRQLTIVT